MTEKENPAFLVDAYSDPAIVKIRGRVSFLNSGPLREFFGQTTKDKNSYVLDFQECSSMDSTFLGILAGAAMDLRRKNPPGSLVLCRLGARNLELIRNLGLHRIMTVDSGDKPLDFKARPSPLADPGGNHREELEKARLVLEAHENLIEVDEGNRKKFQDVIAFLQNQVERK